MLFNIVMISAAALALPTSAITDDNSRKGSQLAAHLVSQVQKDNRKTSWPAGVVAEISEGAVACRSLKSAHRARAIENNPYAAQADDCIILPEVKYAVRVQHLAGNVSKVVLKGSYIELFMPSHHIAE